ncbi:unnamed protein product, partial [Staurois parvus]
MWHRQKALMDTDRWCFWGYTDHQGTLMISVHLSAYGMSGIYLALTYHKLSR